MTQPDLLDPAALVGKKISRYQIVRLIGQGGMGFVYEAVDPEIERRAAIKILKAEYFGNADMAARFRNEARAVNIISHPSLVSVFEFGHLPDGSAYIVMEYLDGETLRQRMHRLGRIGEGSILIARQICSALCAAHAKNIIHRDLKPANIMIVVDPDVVGGERVKVLDFGIAKLVESQGPNQPNTRTGTVLGSPGYMAPEQYRDIKAVDSRSDVYSLGVILYEMLAGRPPLVGGNDAELLAKHVYEEPPDLRKVAPDVPSEVAEFVHRMLRKQPKDRPGSPEVLRFLSEHAGVPVGISSPLPIIRPQGNADPLAATNLAPSGYDGETYYAPDNAPGAQAPGGNPAPPSSSPAAPVPSEKPAAPAASAKPAAPAASDPPAAPAPGPGPAAPASGRRSARRWLPFLLGALVVALLATGLALRGFRGPPVAAPPVTVRWEISSIPPGAEVVRVSSQQSLGRTPLRREQPSQAGSEELVLRHPGYADLPVRIDLGVSSTVSLSLVPLPAPPPPATAPAPATDDDKRALHGKGSGGSEHRRRTSKKKADAQP